MTALAVIAKPPIPGRAKTRLTPPFSPEQAAGVARALLLDTLDAVRGADVDRLLLFWDGDAPLAEADGFEHVRQPAGDLDARLAALFDLVDEPLLLVGMDTPQLDVADLVARFRGASAAGAGAVLGPASDGGFWTLGMRRPDGDVLRGVPMSRADTGRLQEARLRAAGHRVALLPTLTDVDDLDSARLVRDLVPDESRYARAFDAARTPELVR